MQAMLDGLEGRLAGGAPRRSLSVKVHLPEGVLAAELGRLQDGAPGIEI